MSTYLLIFREEWPGYVPDPNELRYAHTGSETQKTRPAQLIWGKMGQKRLIVRKAIHLEGRN